MKRDDGISADVIVLTLGLGALAYGIYSRSKRVAGYETTPPPVLEVPKPPQLPDLPGVPSHLLKACAAIIDSPGGTLNGPVAPKGMEPDTLTRVVDELVRRLRLADPSLEAMATVVDGGWCVGDADGADQFLVNWVLYERVSNTSLQLVSGVIVLEDGTYRVTAMDPATTPKPSPWTAATDPAFAEYVLPISPDI
jgi:hypothetical protein